MNNFRIPNLLTAGLITALSACVAGTHDRTIVPAVAAAKATGHSRVVSVFLEVDTAASFSPVPGLREVTAEPVIQTQVAQAKGRYELNGIDVVIIGGSCRELRAKITTLTECAESDITQNSYGPEVVKGVAGADGLVKLTLEQRAYRLTVERVRTSEDASCWWSGSVVVQAQSTSVKLPMLVYCE